MFTSIIKNSSKIAAQKELGRISGNIMLNHTGYTHLSATK